MPQAQKTASEGGASRALHTSTKLLCSQCYSMSDNTTFLSSLAHLSCPIWALQSPRQDLLPLRCLSFLLLPRVWLPSFIKRQPTYLTLFSRQAVSDSSRPHGLQHARLLLKQGNTLNGNQCVWKRGVYLYSKKTKPLFPFTPPLGPKGKSRSHAQSFLKNAE